MQDVALLAVVSNNLVDGVILITININYLEPSRNNPQLTIQVCVSVCHLLGSIYENKLRFIYY